MSADFSIKSALQQWRFHMQKHEGIAPEMIEELEANLYDRIEEFQAEGYPEQEAFQKAVLKMGIDPKVLADEYYRAENKDPKWAPWNRIDFFYLLPNYFIVALRNLLRRKYYSGLSYLNLVVGIFCIAFIFLYLQYELSYDQFHQDSNRIYRITSVMRSQGYSLIGFKDYYRTSSENQRDQIQNIREISGIETACHFKETPNQYLEAVDTQQEYIGEQIIQTNTPKAFFSIFSWDFLLGSPENLRKNSFQIVFTESEAGKIYGENWAEKDILGKEFIIADTAYTLSAVIQDIPENSHFDFDILLNKNKIEYWGAYTYLKLKRGVGAESVAAQLNEKANYINSRMATAEVFGGFFLQKLEDIHFQSDLLYELKPQGQEEYLYIFMAMGIVILLISISNYTNLTNALNNGRMREIGMRKVVGARTTQLIQQFLFESALLAFLSIPIVILLVQLFIPVFNKYMEVNLHNLYINNWVYFFALTTTIVLIGLLSGAYPAFYLSAKSILKLFKDLNFKGGRSPFSVRKLLILFQFILLIALCSITYLINRQIHFVQNKDLGYRREGVMYVKNVAETQLFIDKVTNLAVVEAAGAGTPLGRNPYNQTTYRLEGKTDVFDDAFQLRFDKGSLLAYGIETEIAPAYKDWEALSSEKVLLNEAAVEKFKNIYRLEKADLIGKSIIIEPEYTADDGTIGFPKLIIGFYKNIHMFSLREQIDPYFIQLYKEPFNDLVVLNFSNSKLEAIIPQIDKLYSELHPDAPFEYSFMEENLADLYKSERKAANLTVMLSIISFILAFLGLLALTTLLTTLRKKEIGIRKVLGASTFHIVRLFNKEYISLILLALLLATPIAFWTSTQWLQNFAYRIEVQWWIFPAAALLTWGLTAAAVSITTIKTSFTNPVKSIRNDQ